MRNEDDVAIYSAYDDYKSLDVAEAEKNLMRAILKSALDAVSYTHLTLPTICSV